MRCFKRNFISFFCFEDFEFWKLRNSIDPLPLLVQRFYFGLTWTSRLTQEEPCVVKEIMEFYCSLVANSVQKWEHTWSDVKITLMFVSAPDNNSIGSSFKYFFKSNAMKFLAHISCFWNGNFDLIDINQN